MMDLGAIGRAMLLIGFNPSQVNTAFGGVRSQLTGLISGLQAHTSQAWGNVLTPSSLAGAVGVSMGFYQMIDSAAAFDDAMTESLAIQSGVSDAMRAEMEKTAKDVSRSLGLSATEAAKGYFMLASSGMTAEQQLKAMPVVAKMVRGGNMGMAESADILMDTMSALGLKSEDANQHMKNMVYLQDAIAKANVISNGTIQGFAEALQNRGASTMRAYNISLEDGLALLAGWADQGVKGRRAGEGMEILFRDLTRGAVANKEAFAKHNVTVFDSNGKMRKMSDIVFDLEKALGGLSDQQKTVAMSELGITDTLSGLVKQLLGTSKAIKKYEQDLKSAGGTMDEVVNKQMQSPIKRLQMVREKINLLIINLGRPLLKALLAVLEPIAMLAEKFVALDDATGGMLSNLVVAASGFIALRAAVAYFGGGDIFGMLVSGAVRFAGVMRGMTGAMLFKSIWTGLKSATSMFGGFFASVGRGFMSLPGPMSILTGAIRVLIAVCTSSLTPAILAIGAVFFVVWAIARGIFKQISAWMETNKALIASWGEKISFIWFQIKKNFVAVWNSIVGFFEWVGQKFVEFADGLFGVFGLNIGGMLDSIGQFITNFLDILSILNANWKLTWDLAATLVALKMVQIVNAVSVGCVRLWTMGEVAAEKLMDAFKDWFDFTLDMLSEMWNVFESLLKAFWTGIKAALTGGDFSDAFKEKFVEATENARNARAAQENDPKKNGRAFGDEVNKRMEGVKGPLSDMEDSLAANAEKISGEMVAERDRQWREFKQGEKGSAKAEEGAPGGPGEASGGKVRFIGIAEMSKSIQTSLGGGKDKLQKDANNKLGKIVENTDPNKQKPQGPARMGK
jgi:TP901 family phage tail tape measure protein